MQTRTYTFTVMWDADESVWVTFVPDLDNLSTWGETRDEAIAHTREAIEGYIEAADREGIPLPAPSATAETVAVTVP